MIIVRGNDALEVNPPGGELHLSENGSNWLWAVTAVMVVSFLAFRILSWKPLHGEKIFHYLFSITLLVGSIAYFAMASDLGWHAIRTVNQRNRGDSRQIFYAKYIYWVVSFPAATMALELLSGVSWATIVQDIAFSWIWVVSYLIASFTETNYKWGFFVFGTVSMFCLLISMFTTGLKSAKRVGATRDYTIFGGWLALLFVLYPLAFGLSDGGNRIKVTAGFIFFGILDLLMIPVIAFGFLFMSRKWDYGKLNLHFTQYGRVARGEDVVEKGPAPAGSGGLTGEAAA